MLLINVWKEITSSSKRGNPRLGLSEGCWLGKRYKSISVLARAYLLATRGYRVWAHASQSCGPLLLDGLADACHMITSNKIKLALIFKFSASLWLMPFFKILYSVIVDAYIIPNMRAHSACYWPSSEYPVILNYITKRSVGLLWTYPL